jgi:hypothetical protein
MQKVLLVCLITALFTLLGCSPYVVRFDYDHEYDFSKFKTYCWPGPDQTDKYNNLVKNTIVYHRIQSAVNRVMQEKGLSEVNCDEADLCVVAHAGVKDRMVIYDYQGYYGWYRPWWGPYGGYTDVSYYEEGTLVLDLVDEKTKELAWRGTATGVVKDYEGGEEMQKDIDAAVTQMLSHYPPAKR